MSSVEPTKIRPIVFLGLNPNVKGNVHFIKDRVVVYLAGSVFIIQDLRKESQRYIEIPRSIKTINIVIVSPDKNYLAMAECGVGPTISVFDLNSGIRIKHLGYPDENSTATCFVSLQFSHDSQYIAAIIGEPDWMLLWYNWETGKIESRAKLITALHPKGPITEVTTHPEETSVILVVGEGYYRLFTLFSNEWQQFGFQRGENMPLTCACWLAPDRALAGTRDGRFVLVEFGDLVCIYNVHEFTEITIMPREERLKLQNGIIKLDSSDITEEQKKGAYAVRIMLGFKTGFAYSCSPGVVVVFQKVEDHYNWIKKNIIRVPIPTTSPQKMADLTEIYSMCVNPSETMLIVGTKRSTIFGAKIMVDQDFDEVPELYFNVMLEGFHHGPIKCVTISLWKPIFLTMGAIDQTIIVWNFLSSDVIFQKQFGAALFSCDIHPSGLFVLIGLANQLQFHLIHTNNFKSVRSLTIRACPVVKFAEGGHIFAAVSDYDIQVHSAVKFHHLWTFKGHMSPVFSLMWSDNDLILSTTAQEGSICQWDMKTGERILNVFSKMCSHNDLAKASRNDKIYSAGSDGTIKEFTKGKVTRRVDLKQYALHSIAIGHKDSMMFAAGENATIVSIKYPFVHPTSLTEYTMHRDPVTKVRLTHNDTKLVTTSKDGSICIWGVSLPELTREEVISLRDSNYVEDSLIEADYLDTKLQIIQGLKIKVKQAEAKYEYYVRSTAIAHSKTIQRLRESCRNVIRKLRNNIEAMENKHVEREKAFTAAIEVFLHRHGQVAIDAQDNLYIKLAEEYNKTVELTKSLKQLKKASDKKYDKMVSKYEELIEEHKNDARIAVEKKQLSIKKLGTVLRRTIEKHEGVKEQIEVDADIEIADLRTTFEKQLADEAARYQKIKYLYGLAQQKGALQGRQIMNLGQEVSELRLEVLNLKSDLRDAEKDLQMEKDNLLDAQEDLSDKELELFDARADIESHIKIQLVLDAKIRKLHSMVEPLQQQLIKNNDFVEEVYAELVRLRQLVENQDQLISSCENRIFGAEAFAYKQKVLTRKFKYFVRSIKGDVYRICGNTYTNQVQIQADIRRLFKKYSMGELEYLNIDYESIQDEDIRCREYYENTYRSMNNIVKNLAKMCPIEKLLKDNKELLIQANYVKDCLEDRNHQLVNYRKMIGCGPKIPHSSFDKVVREIFTFHSNAMNDKEREIKEMRKCINLLQEHVDKLHLSLQIEKENLGKVQEPSLELLSSDNDTISKK